MSPVAAHADGVTLAVKARPGAKKNALLGIEAGMLKVSITAPPEDGKANEAIVELLRDAFGLKRSEVELLRGKTHRNKVILLRKTSVAAIESRLAQIG